ncbi:MAG: AAA family ATPase [Candidatus Limnocylindrales bacterium]
MPASSVLLLASDPSFVETIRASLAGVGYQVSATADPDEVFRQAAGQALVIVDTVTGPRSAREVCHDLRATPALSRVPVLCIAQTDDVEERVGFLESGADEVMVKPFDGRELEARVEALLVRFQHARDLTPVGVPGGPIPATRKMLAFFSPKGGVGTTTVAVNIAVALAAQRPERVALFDLDLQWGQVATHLDLRPRSTVVELCRDSQALAEPELMRSYAERHASGLAVYCGPPRPDQGELVTAPDLGQMLRGARGLYDVVVVDAGSMLDERCLTILEEADDVVFVFYPEIAAIKALLSLLEVLADVGGVGTKTTFVINHLFARELLKIKDVENTLGARIAIELPHDPLVHLKAVNEGIPVVRGAPHSQAAEALGKLAQLLVGAPRREAAPQADSRKGLGGLLRRA